MKIHLTDKKCVACEGGIPPLSRDEVSLLLSQVHEWQVNPENTQLRKVFQFVDFKSAMNFANEVATIAEDEGHHPDMEISWGKVTISLTTHAISGLSENDFILAAKVGRITKP